MEKAATTMADEKKKDEQQKKPKAPKGDKAQASAEPRRSGGATACGQGNAAAAGAV